MKYYISKKISTDFDQAKGFALYMGKMMLSGRMDEAYKIISSNFKHLGEVL